MIVETWSCPIPTHHAVDTDGDVACCTYLGCLRRADDPDRNSCECYAYECEGGCCGGQCRVRRVG